MESLQVYSFLGNTASILGLCMTLWLLREAWKIRAYYRRHIVLPKFQKDLIKHSRNLKRAIDNKQIQDVKTYLHRCEVGIERVPRFSDKLLAQRAFRVQDSIRELLAMRKVKVGFLSSASDVYSDLQGLIEALETFLSEDQWTAKT